MLVSAVVFAALAVEPPAPGAGDAGPDFESGCDYVENDDDSVGVGESIEGDGDEVAVEPDGPCDDDEVRTGPSDSDGEEPRKFPVPVENEKENGNAGLDPEHDCDEADQTCLAADSPWDVDEALQDCELADGVNYGGHSALDPYWESVNCFANEEFTTLRRPPPPKKTKAVQDL